MSGSRNWMRRLAQHYAWFRRTYPEHRLLIVLDIDGIVVDPRHVVRHRLLEYDRIHDTDHFDGLEATDVRVRENYVEYLLVDRGLPVAVRRHVLNWYLHDPSEPALDALRPCPGVLGMIRWFQLQPATFVGLNTARPERLRDETLRSLNTLGRALRVEFDADLLHMSESGDESSDPNDPITSKVEGLRAFARAGFRTCAVIDNEPAGIRALAEADESGEILFLHARAPSDSGQVRRPARSAVIASTSPHWSGRTTFLTRCNSSGTGSTTRSTCATSCPRGLVGPSVTCARDPRVGSSSATTVRGDALDP